MLYTIEDLLTKMGAPEVAEKGRLCWHYFNAEKSEEAGFAEVRLSPDNQHLVAELRHLRHNYTDDDGVLHETYNEHFHLVCRKSGDKYKVMSLTFDGTEYATPPKGVVELALSMFHAAAIDISLHMVEQAFTAPTLTSTRRRPAKAKKQVPVATNVIPFRPRGEVPHRMPAVGRR